MSCRKSCSPKSRRSFGFFVQRLAFSCNGVFLAQSRRRKADSRRQSSLRMSSSPGSPIGFRTIVSPRRIKPNPLAKSPRYPGPCDFCAATRRNPLRSRPHPYSLSAPSLWWESRSVAFYTARPMVRFYTPSRDFRLCNRRADEALECRSGRHDLHLFPGKSSRAQPKRISPSSML